MPAFASLSQAPAHLLFFGVRGNQHQVSLGRLCAVSPPLCGRTDWRVQLLAISTAHGHVMMMASKTSVGRHACWADVTLSPRDVSYRSWTHHRTLTPSRYGRERLVLATRRTSLRLSTCLASSRCCRLPCHNPPAHAAFMCRRAAFQQSECIFYA